MINARSRDARCEGRSGQCESKSDAAACEQNCGGGVRGGARRHTPLSRRMNKLLSEPPHPFNPTSQRGLRFDGPLAIW